ncbi:nucleotidyltransferase domain-containing protein [Fontivita pretiosa]|uniref:nucleotidyltransferase domain-containing protein n=1 Tax=Fontivita pretiosa TaxID=2989684 RepID=UPI003D171506
MNAPQLENFASVIHRSLIAPRIILFGSRLLGTQRTDSDIDLVVVSPSFHRVGLYERHRLVEQAVADLNWQSDVLLRAPAEWEAGGFLREMVESQLNDPDEWRRLLDAKGRKIGYRDVLAARSGFDLTPAD